jgi:predicted DNA-binding transcriptional regulator YafY
MYQAARPPMRRIMAIDQAMRAGEWPNATTLARSLEVNARTIRRDIQFLRDQLRAPVEFDARHNGYYYAEPTYRLPHFQMSEGELLALYLAERLLRSLEGTPFESDLRGAIEKLGAMLPDGISVRLDERADLLAVLPAARPRYDAEAFRTLTTAVVCRHRLEMVYWTAGRDETTRRTFDPYDLALVEDGWYAVGYCHLRREVRVFAVQRVRSVRPAGETFDRPADFRVEDYMQGSFRAVRGDGDYRVVLRFAPAVAGRIDEKQWHPSQTIEPQPDGGLILTLNLSSLIEIKRWVLSWGAKCEVVEPTELRDAVDAEARMMLSRDFSSHRMMPEATPR